MNPSDLLKTAYALLPPPKGGRPTGASLRRAVSSACYALFHCLARECADLLIGGSGSDRSDAGWRQVYRAIEHGPAKTISTDIAAVESAIAEFKSAPIKDRRAFCAYILFKDRSD